MEMVVKINGVPLVRRAAFEDGEFVPVLRRTLNPKLKQMVITLWATCGALMTRHAYAFGELFTELQPVIDVIKELIMGLGSLAIIVGLVMFVFRKRWGTATLKVTAFILLGAFLAPTAILLLAIIGEFLNDALMGALERVMQNRGK